MNLHRLLQKRLAAGRPVRVGLIGAGKFGSMFLAQVPTTPGIEVAAIADLAPDRARAACRAVGWTEARIEATHFTEDAAAMIGAGEIEVVVEATGHASAGIAHARRAIAMGKHIVMVNVEADVLAGPLLARQAARGRAWSTRLAYGDQPALICELVDWARACGFAVLAAGKGTKYLPSFHASTPDTVWDHYGLTAEAARAGGMNPQMFNSFLDGTKSGIEMAAVANATGLTPPPDGLAFPPVGTDALARVLRPGNHDLALHHAGQVEVISSVHRDGTTVEHDLRWGVYVVFETDNPVHDAVLHRIRCRHRSVRQGLGALPTVSPDRARTQRLGSVGCVARRADRRARWFPRRRGGDRQARLARRRDAGRGGRVAGLGQVDAGGSEPRHWRAADRAGKSAPADRRRSGRSAGDVGPCAGGHG